MVCRFGEGLSKWSWLQLAGFVVLSLGMLMFNGTIKLFKEDKKPEEQEEKKPLVDMEQNPTA